MKTKIIALAFALLSVTSAPSFAQNVPLNIAVVDIEAVLRIAEAPKKIREQVNNIRTAFRTEMKKEEEALLQANQALAQKQSLMSADAFNEERRKFDQQVREVQKKIQQKNVSLQNAQKAAQNQVMAAMRKIVLEISKQNSYTLILRRAQTLVVADKLDITQTVIDMMNKQLPSVTVTAK